MSDEARFRALEEKLDSLEAAIEAEKRAAMLRENQRLKWGIGALGTIVMGLSAWIWAQVGHLFDLGGPPR